MALKFTRSFWILLIIGVALRCVALNQPLVDAHLIRQCQTAAATKALIETPGFHLSSKIPWLGDLDAHYILELPVYNYLVMAAWWITGNLDLSGKVPPSSFGPRHLFACSSSGAGYSIHNRRFGQTYFSSLRRSACFMGSVHAGNARASPGLCVRLAGASLRGEPFSRTMEPLRWLWTRWVVDQTTGDRTPVSYPGRPRRSAGRLETIGSPSLLVGSSCNHCDTQSVG